jgi:formylglycine-generating enzyme required for sulfatase activity|tara:strand:+ start:160 stop:552 length:393 start_codon:yes stop_codon:yes gene_type:complete
VLFLITASVFTSFFGFAHAENIIKIPGGPFQTGNPNAEKLQTVELKTFFIDRYELSNREFKNWSRDYAFPKGANAHPVTRLAWKEANQFCLAQEKRLPISLEWEKPARGLDGGIYPWGNKNLKKKPHLFF